MWVIVFEMEEFQNAILLQWSMHVPRLTIDQGQDGALHQQLLNIWIKKNHKFTALKLKQLMFIITFYQAPLPIPEPMLTDHLIIGVLRHLHRVIRVISQDMLKNLSHNMYLEIMSFRIITKSSRGQWANLWNANPHVVDLLGTGIHTQVMLSSAWQDEHLISTIMSQQGAYLGPAEWLGAVTYGGEGWPTQTWGPFYKLFFAHNSNSMGTFGITRPQWVKPENTLTQVLW